MGLETGTYINDLVATNPVGGTDAKSEGDDHLRLIKSVTKATFPGMAGAAWRKQAKSGSYALAATDNMSIIACTAAAITISAVAATVGSAFLCIVRNTSTGIVIVSSTDVPPGGSVFVVSDGSAISVIGINTETTTHENLSALSTITLTGLSATSNVYYQLFVKNLSVSSGTPTFTIRSGVGSIDTGSNYRWSRVSTTDGAVSTPSGSASDTSIAPIGALSTTPSDLRFDITVQSGYLRMMWQVVAYNGTNYITVNGSGFYIPASGTPDRIQLISTSFADGDVYLREVR